MKHIDHRTLEIYLLDAEAGRKRQRSVARHLAQCPHCRAIAREMEEFYSAAGRHLEGKHEATDAARLAVARRTQSLLEGRVPVEVEAIPVREGALQRFFAYARRHPAVVTAGTLATVACAGFVLGRFTLRGPTDLNPVQYQYETSRGVLIAQNRNNETLWERPIWNLADRVAVEVDRRIQYTVVRDIDGDGTSEVLTTLPDLAGGAHAPSNLLRIFNGDRDPLAENVLGHAVKFKGQEYPAEYLSSGPIITLESAGETGVEIIAATSAFRGPFLISRLDGRGEVLGEYWHQGQLPGMYRIGRSASFPERILALGVNNADTVETHAVLVVLDPLKLRDTTESSATRGYGYSPSLAEEFYIRIPRSDIAEALGVNTEVRYLLSADSATVLIVVGMGETGNGGAFEYVFSSDLRLLNVLPIDGIEAIHAELVKQGQIRSRFDRSYLNHLKSAIEYWDGRKWIGAYSPVRFPALGR